MISEMCMIFISDDNHIGYLNYRRLMIPISDNVSIDIIATYWREQQ